MTGRHASSLFAHPVQLLEMARRFVAEGHPEQAASLARAALKHGDDTGLLQAIGRDILTHKIPGFHQSMLRDTQRNRAYAQAIVELAPGRKVLDIGTGTGLLAMLAARAGARHVFACEHDQRLACTAREIIAANGLADRVTVVPLHSSKLDRNRDLAGGVDLVISEIFADNLLGEGVLPSLDDARRRLCLPDAIFLPSKAAVRVALVGAVDGGPSSRFDPIGTVEGCDLALFNRHIPGRKRFRAVSGELALRSEPADLFLFKFGKDAPHSDQTCIAIHSSGGQVSGVAQWIWFETNSGHEYENSFAGTSDAHWQLLYHAFDAPLETTPGQSVMIHGWRDQKNLLIWQNDVSNVDSL